MNRIDVESFAGGRKVLVGSQQHRRERIISGGDSREGDQNLGLFSRSHGGYLISSPCESDGQNESIKLEKLSVGSAKLGRGGMDDLLDVDIGKHDYDWLLTPPESPLCPSDASENHLSSTAPRGRSTARSVSTARASRLSVSQSENGNSTRPVRSSSVTRPSISSSYSASYSSNNRTSILNTSSASITSRPSTPGNRSTSISSSRTSSTSRPVPARSSTPIKTRPTTSCPGEPIKTRPTTSSPGDKARPLHNSRPSTPTSRPLIPTNSNPSAARPRSRPSTPTRRPTTPSSASTPSRSPSVGPIPAVNTRNPGPGSRPSSPARARAPVRPIDLPDFPHEVPPNLRTKLPERPASVGRSRPGLALTVRANSNSEPVVPPSSNRRHSLPVLSRGRFPENSPKGQLQSNGNDATPPETQKPRPVKPATSTESTGFGRTISKKSIDMALRHMDIRQGIGGIRGASLFPQSIRSAAPKARPARMSDPIAPVTSNVVMAEIDSCHRTISPECNGVISENGDLASKSTDRNCLLARQNELDLYGSSRYDAMLLKEDSKNMNWLHSVEDKSDQSPVFDHRFEPLPEPFGLL